MRVQGRGDQEKRNPIRKSGKHVVTGSTWLLHGILFIGVLLSALPVLLIISVSFSSEASILSNGYSFFPKELSLSTYRFLFREPSIIFRAYGVTILTTVLSTLLGLTTVALFAYPLSRREYRFTEQITFFMFFTMLFSGGLVAYYIVMTGLFSMRDNLLAMILPFGFNAFWVIVMRTFYRTQIPDSLVESARIDGAGEWRTLVQIVLPLSVPGLATIALFTALAVWNDWFNCMLFISRTELSNLQTMIYRALRSVQMLRDIMAKIGSAGVLADAAAKMPSETFRMALCVVAIGPIILAYPFFQKYFIRGLSVGAVKG
jgi:putative aldouronate transport system permease protein